MIDEKAIEHLITLGKNSLEATVMESEPYMPKIAIKYDGSEQWNLIAYAGPMEGLVESLVLVSEDPISWIAVTIDSFHMDIGSMDEVIRYGGKLEEMFIKGDSRVKESLRIVIATDADQENIALPYHRDGVAVGWFDTKRGGESRLSAQLQQVVRESLV